MPINITSHELFTASQQLKSFIDRFVPEGRLTGALPSISTDYVKLQDEVMWGGVWQVPGLDVTLRSIATISAQCCNGWGFGLHHQVRVGLSLGMSPQKIKGLFLQLMFYAGIPATVFALSQAQRVINERTEWISEDRMPLKVDWLDSVEKKFQHAQSVITSNMDSGVVLSRLDSLEEQFIPELHRLIESYEYGEVWRRSDLSTKERMACILVALMCRGHWHQFGEHVRRCLNGSLTQREVCELVSQAGWYRGWPYVEDALAIIDELLAESTREH